MCGSCFRVTSCKMITCSIGLDIVGTHEFIVGSNSLSELDFLQARLILGWVFMLVLLG